MTSDQDIAWLAGFIDGEGSIIISKPYRQAVGYEQIQTVIKIANTIEDNIKRCKDILSRIIGREVRYVPYTHRASGIGYRPIYVLSIFRQSEIRALLVAIRPSLCGKLPQCDLMLEYLDVAPRRGNGHGYDESHYEYPERMAQLNRRYAPGEWASSQRETERLAPTAQAEGEETIRTATQVAEVSGN